MDGNGRWAKKRGMPRVFGHKAGVETVKSLVKHCGDIGLPVLTLYAFSTENFKRPKDEVNALMNLLCEFLRKDIDTLVKNGVKLNVIGNYEIFPDELCKDIENAVIKTQNNKKMILNIALGYGSRQEMVDAFKAMQTDIEKGTLKKEEITEETISRYLYTKGLPDPDFIIRTSGEQRLSNFLMYQAAYSELYFTPVPWPDFTNEQFDEALKQYSDRDRRFGGI
jgi:undecaprenyl diphosphate synthase